MSEQQQGTQLLLVMPVLLGVSGVLLPELIGLLLGF